MNNETSAQRDFDQIYLHVLCLISKWVYLKVAFSLLHFLHSHSGGNDAKHLQNSCQRALQICCQQESIT